MYTQKIAVIFNITFKSQSVQEPWYLKITVDNKFLENKSGRIFLRLTGLLYKSLQTNLGVCKPTFYTFYTSHKVKQYTICHTDLGKNAVCHNFSRQIALSQ